jgi:endo-1,4-beta-D-glucanase Y
MGMTARHVAAKKGNLDMFRKIWDFVKKKLTTEEIKNKVLLAADVKGKTVLHMAAKGGKLELLQEILDWAEENLTSKEIKINCY